MAATMPEAPVPPETAAAPAGVHAKGFGAQVHKLKSWFQTCLHPQASTTTAKSAPAATTEGAAPASAPGMIEQAKTQVMNTFEAAKAATTSAITTFQQELHKHGAAGEPAPAGTTPATTPATTTPAAEQTGPTFASLQHAVAPSGPEPAK